MTSRTRHTALILLIAVLATACAGRVGQLDSGAPASDPISSEGAANGPAPAAHAPSSTVHPSVSAPRGRPATAVAHSGAGTPPAAPAGAAGTSGASRSPGTGPAASPGPAGSSAAGAPSAGSGSPTGELGPGTPPPVPGGATRTGVTAGTLALGLFFPRTGAYAGLFRNVPVVAQAAFDEAGPIHGRRLVLKTYDDGTAAAATIQTEEKRAKDEVFALVSAVGEANVVLAPLADRHGIPLIVGNIDEKVALPLTHAFAVLPFWARQARILPGFIQNVLGGGTKRIGIVYEGTSTAIDAKNAFKVKAEAAGLRVVYEQPMPRTSRPAPTRSPTCPPTTSSW